MTHPGTSDLPLYADTRGAWASPGKLSKPGSYERKPNYKQALPVKAGRTQATYFQREVHPTGECQLSGGTIVNALHDGRVLSIVLTTIKTELRFEDLWDRIRPFGGVLQTEHHLLSNQEVYSVLTYIVRPRTRLEMQK